MFNLVIAEIDNSYFMSQDVTEQSCVTIGKAQRMTGMFALGPPVQRIC